jgi:hypothetical protein
MPETKLKNSQLPSTLQEKTIDASNDINTTTAKLKITGGSNGQVLTTDGSGNLSWLTAQANISDGDKGDITVGSSGTTWTIDNDAVSYAKIQNVSATSRLLGRASSGSGDIEEITIGSGLSLSGTTLSASGGGGSLGAPTAVVTKTADETVTNSTTLQADDHLTYAFTSGKNYYIELRLLSSRTNTSNAPAIKYAFDGNSNGYIATTLADGTSNTSSNVNTNGGVPRPLPIQITLIMTANYTGTFLFAQNTLQSGTGITVHKGSQMLIWEVA